jgi:hypothetical protein
MRFSILRPWSGSGVVLLILFVICFGATPFFAQDATDRPENPTQKAALELTDHPLSVHRFWDRTNILLFAGVGVTRGMDYASTRNFQARGRDEILIPDDVVNNSAGFASLEAAGAATSIGISYLLHRTGHHKLERWMSIGHIGVTGFGDVRNYCLKTKHRP